MPAPPWRKTKAVDSRRGWDLPFGVFGEIESVYRASSMVHARISPLDNTFFALSNPTRRAMLARLAERDMSVRELAAPFELSPAAISKHLGVLKRAGLLRQRRAGLGRECSLQPAPLREAVNWLEEHRHMWTQQLDSFARYTEQLSKRKKKRRR